MYRSLLYALKLFLLQGPYSRLYQIRRKYQCVQALGVLDVFLMNTGRKGAHNNMAPQTPDLLCVTNTLFNPNLSVPLVVQKTESNERRTHIVLDFFSAAVPIHMHACMLACNGAVSSWMGLVFSFLLPWHHKQATLYYYVPVLVYHTSLCMRGQS